MTQKAYTYVRNVLSKMGRAMIDTEQYGWAGQFRWPLLSIIVGIIAGFGAILFEESLRWALYHFIHLPTGFIEPRRGAEVRAGTVPCRRSAPGFFC